ncbi:hypothetical protein GCM10022251_11900 [Phytohabitans flavus]|uniref:Lipoprotein n=1 Tax=Phytohabitans flavus TaxID=1076124 RepID=A0A6F8XJM1_9ACTN|nr:hypothetical protein [Phytohabitans flavus]BCB74003.1 hypothetical protein Pflav_004130 [Phytohabitans flavus]
MRRIAALAAALLLLAACESGKAAAPAEPAAPATAAPAAAAQPGCGADVPSRVLPEWARTGFSDPEPSIPHVLGDQGDIVAIIFGYPLHAPTLPDRSNKILWVSRVPQQPASPLVIEARPDGKGDPVTREISGGAGPSTVDLPTAGCWHLQLKWSDHTDTMRLTYKS